MYQFKIKFIYYIYIYIYIYIYKFIFAMFLSLFTSDGTSWSRSLMSKEKNMAPSFVQRQETLKSAGIGCRSKIWNNFLTFFLV